MLFKRRDFTVLLSLAVPIVMAGLVESSNGFISVIFLGHLSKEDLAAGALVSWFFATMMIILWGVFVGVSTLIARHQGAKDHTGIALITRDALWLSVLLVLPVSVMIWNLSPIFQWFGESATLVNQAIPYMHALSWSILPDFSGLVLIQLMIGLGRVRANLVFSMIWVPLNVLCNYIFIFGKWGFPEMDIAGLGWGTTVSYWITTLGLMVYMLFDQNYNRYIWALKTWTKPIFMWEIIKVGLPMGLMWFFEVGAFFAIALLMGYISVSALAANQITLQFISLFTSVVFSIAQAITVKMGNHLGSNNTAAASRCFWAGLTLSVIFVLLVACCEWLFPHFLITLDVSGKESHSEGMIAFAVSFLAVSAGFQILEGVRISLFGALRAHKDTHFALISTILSFWCVGIPLGYYLHFSVGASGYWWGMIVSVIPNIFLLSWRYSRVLKKQGQALLVN